MSESIPKYCALCDDESGEIYDYGTGDTPDEAYDEFFNGGEFESHCRSYCLDQGQKVDVYIYTCVPVSESDWPEDEIDPEWDWCLGQKIETRPARAK